MDVAYWMLAILCGVLLCSTVFFVAVAKEHRFRSEIYPPRWAGGLVRQFKVLREEIVSGQDRLNELVRLAAEDLATIKGKLESSEACEVIDFSGLNDFVNQLDTLANSVADEVAEQPVEDAPVEDAPVEDAPVEEAPVEEPPVEDAPSE